MRVELHNADCLQKLDEFPAESIDACVVDGPYGIGFMGKAWDGKDIVALTERKMRKGTERPEGWVHNSPAMAAGEYDLSPKGKRAFQEWTRIWAEKMNRILKPGAWLVSFSSTRTYHRMTCGIEDAGFEIRDQLGWMFFSGFPKSLNLKGDRKGWGTALKPAWEPICLARKPLIGTVEENIAKYGTGALFIDGCRIPLAEGEDISVEREGSELDTNGAGWGFKAVSRDNSARWPANVLIGTDGTPEAEAEMLATFPAEAGAAAPVKGTEPSFAFGANGIYGEMKRTEGAFHADSGSASRFFFVAKASRADRDAGCEILKAMQRDDARKAGNPGGDNPRNRGLDPRKNFHPTVKPTELMRYLCRLVTPPGGTVIDHMMGSGSTGRGAILEGFDFIGIEKEELYMPIARARIREAEGELFSTT